MSVRSRIAAPVEVTKVFGPGVPESFVQGEQASQMTATSPFSPGTPIGPYDGYDRTPRSRDYATGYNIATRPRTHERVSFETLTGLIEAYDVASICIWHRIDSLRSLDWKLIAADGYGGDVTDAIAVGMEALKKPDGENDFEAWLGKWLYDVLAYDAGALARMRNRGGRCVGLQPVDGTTIAPLLDYWGNSPKAASPGGPEPEAYVQYAQGLPFNWLTRSDLIYRPFRAVNKSIYGRAPIESILLNANTDIRFQLHFLQRFTDGNIPEAFASAPESWSPDQIETWQELWDALMYGDQTRKSQIRWMPGGSTIVWSNEKDFTDQFSLFLMRKTTAAFHVVPTDLGFTENANLASGESQADVQHRLGDLPLGRYAQRVLTSFLQDDLGLPLKHLFDWGEEQDDRLAQAQADQIYVEHGVIGGSELRQLRYGLEEPEGQQMPRYIFTSRSGPVPLSALYAVAGPVDPENGAPDPDQPLPEKAFTEIQGVITNPAMLDAPLAGQEFGPAAIPPAPPMQAPGELVPAPVAKDGEGGTPTAGITSETGIYGDPLIRDDEDEEHPVVPGGAHFITEDEARQAAREAVAKEMAVFRNFRRKRRQAGQWHDFTFNAVDAGTARRLNTEGRQSVAKAASGYTLSPRSGMISLDVPDGLISPLPGGVTDFHVTVVYLGPDVDDDLLVAVLAAARDAAASVPGPLEGMLSGISSFPPSGSSDGKVPAFIPVMLPGAEPLRAALEYLSASEHPDWHPHVTVAYMEPGDSLPGPLPPTPVTFTHLSVHRGDEVTRFPLGPGGGSDCCGADCCAGGCCDGSGGCGCGTLVDDSAPIVDEVAKAADADPKARTWPGWKLNGPAVAYWAPKVTAAVTLPQSQLNDLASGYLAANPAPSPDAPPQKRERNAAAAAWLTTQGVSFPLGGIASGIVTDGYLIGTVSATSLVTGEPAATGDWKPGAADAGRLAALGAAVPATAAGDAADDMTGAYLAEMGRSLADSQDAGLTAAAAGAALASVVTDSTLAAGIVLERVVTASAAGAVICYGARGIDQVDILNGPNPCSVCAGLAASNPHAPGLVPVHPRCECAEAPHRQ